MHTIRRPFAEQPLSWKRAKELVHEGTETSLAQFSRSEAQSRRYKTTRTEVRAQTIAATNVHRDTLCCRVRLYAGCHQDSNLQLRLHLQQEYPRLLSRAS